MEKLSTEVKSRLFIWKRPLCWLKGHDIATSDPKKLYYYCHRCWYGGACIDMIYSKGKN